MSTASACLTVNGIDVDILYKDIKKLHVGVYPPVGRVRVAPRSASMRRRSGSPSSRGCLGSSVSASSCKMQSGSPLGRWRAASRTTFGASATGWGGTIRTAACRTPSWAAAALRSAKPRHGRAARTTPAVASPAVAGRNPDPHRKVGADCRSKRDELGYPSHEDQVGVHATVRVAASGST
jgi:hypothetical protein